MNRRASLRWRVVVAATLFGAVLSLAFAIATNWVTEDYEHLLLDEILGAQAQDLAAHLERSPGAALPHSDRLAAYLREADGSGDVPAALRELAPGIHEFDRANEADEVHVAVYDVGPRRLYVVLGMASVEEREAFLTRVMAGILLTGTLLSAWLGWLLAGRITGPVARLARAVAERGPDASDGGFAREFAADELGELARSFDRYHERLMAHAERERAFAAEASHGLRTPVAVIRGAAEVLLDDPQLEAPLRERVQRIARGASSLADLLDGLLAVARSADPDRLARTAVDPVLVFEDELREQTQLWHHAGLVALPDAVLHGTVELAERELRIALRVLLRTLAESGSAGQWRWSGDANGVWIRTDADVSRTFSNTDAASDRYVGLGLVGRLCTRLGWSLILGEDAEGRLVNAQLRFAASGVA